MNQRFYSEKGDFLDEFFTINVLPCVPELRTRENQNDSSKCLVDSLDKKGYADKLESIIEWLA